MANGLCTSAKLSRLAVGLGFWIAMFAVSLQAADESGTSASMQTSLNAWQRVSDDEAWAMLPALASGKKQPLPNWAKAIAVQLPRTAAAMHWAERPSERIFEESLFWIQTRTIECNYCMGHCEMLLQVAGLDQPAVAKRLRMLAETDWAAFPPREQRAYAFARKLTRAPHQLTPRDYQTLEQDFGPKRAMSLFFWLCRGLYMTRVSDGFQLPLERENVFGSHDE